MIEVIRGLMMPDAKERMKVQRIPWLEGDQMDMDDIFLPNRLTAEIKTPSHTQPKALKYYTELFDGNEEENKGMKRQRNQRKKILLKGDPGIGKSTMTAKMVYDWAGSTWNLFTLVFFISLKVINPGDPIENIIVDGNITPSLCDEEIPPEEIRKMLKENGDKVLLIFEGFDEQSKNEDVMNMIKGQKFRKCNFLVTSRPHGISEIEQHFTTVATLEGFTKHEARAFIEKLLNEKSKIDSVMTFTEENKSIGVPEMWRYPILLLFICILVNDGCLDLCEKSVTLNDIYERLLSCLYRRYISKRGKDECSVRQKRQTLLKLGKIALAGMEKGKLLYSKREIEEKAGKDAFHYGIIIGYKDRRIVQDVDAEADFLVCFIHQSIQEYLAALFITDEIDRSDRRPEDIWPGVWDTDTISPLPLMLIFALDMAVKLKRAQLKLVLALINAFNCKHIKLTMKGKPISSNIWTILNQAFKSCFKLSHLTITQACLPDDYYVIPKLVESLSDSVRILTFRECIFSHDFGEGHNPNMGDHLEIMSERPTKLDVQCINNNVIPAMALIYLIQTKRCVERLTVNLDNVLFEKDDLIDQIETTDAEVKELASFIGNIASGRSDKREAEMYAFYHSFLFLLSFNLPELQTISVMSDRPNYYPSKENPFCKGENICLQLLGTYYLPQQKPTVCLPDLKTLDIKPVAFPAPLVEVIIKSTGPKNSLTFLRIKCPFSMVFTPLMRENSTLALPSIEYLDIGWPITHLDYLNFEDILPSFHDSKTLKQLTVNSSQLKYFTLLVGPGLPMLEKLEVIWLHNGGYTDIKKAADPCSLPKLQQLEFAIEKESFCLEPEILGQFFIAVQGSLYLTSVDITGQQANGVLCYLVGKDSLPELHTLKADGCDLSPADIKHLGTAAQERRLDKLKTLSISLNRNLAGSLKHLCKEWPSLEEIFVEGIRLTFEDVFYLVTSSGKQMSELRFISCSADIQGIFQVYEWEMSSRLLHVEFSEVPSKEEPRDSDSDSAIDPISDRSFSQCPHQ